MRDTGAGRGILPILVAAVLATAGACSSGDPGPGPTASRSSPDARTAAALRAAEEATQRAGSARITTTTVMGDMLATKTEGALTWSDGSTGTLRITSTGGRLAGTMRELGSTTMDARLLPEAYYAKVGDDFARQIGGKHWIRYDHDDLADLPGDTGTSLSNQLRNTAPIPPVRLLLASDDVRRVGEETVRGERAVHYSGTVEVADLGEGRLHGLRDQLEQAGITTETIDIWINDENLLVKKTENGETANGTMSQTAYYGDYGAEVTAEAPPADDTVDFKDLLGT
ncbi:hypothetical protein [Streptomyces sp. NPDC002845]